MKTKKTWSKTLATLMAVVMLLSAFVFTIPASAATPGGNYTAKGVDSSLMKIDGVVTSSEPWDNVDWSQFSQHDANAKANDKYKILWGGQSVYIMCEFEVNGDADFGGMLLAIDETGKHVELDSNRNPTNGAKGEDIGNRGSDGNKIYENARRIGTQKASGSNSDMTWVITRERLDANDTSSKGKKIIIEAEVKILGYTESNSKGVYAREGNVIGLNILCNTGSTQISFNDNECGHYPEKYLKCTLGDTEFASINVKRVDTSMITLDGYANEEIWGKIPAQTLKPYDGGANAEGISTKTVWGTDENGVAYVYMQITAATTDGRWVYAIDETGGWSGHVDTQANSNRNAIHRIGESSPFNGRNGYCGGGTGLSDFAYGYMHVVDDIITYEFRLKLYTLNETNAAGNIIGLNFSIRDSAGKRLTFNGNDWGENMNLFTKFKLNDEMVSINRNVTLMNGINNTEIRKENVSLGSNYTLPIVDLENGLPFLGWIVGEQLLPAGAQITVADNITITAFSIDLTMEEGAAVRLTETTGMRWITYVNESTLPFAASIVSKGTLIVPEDYLTVNGEAIAFTHAALEASGRVANTANGYLDVVAEEYVPDEYKYKTTEAEQFNGSIVTIQEGNYSRAFAAVGYVKVRYSNGVEAYIYADGSECVRTVKSVAADALVDNTANYNAAERAVLENFAK